MGATVQANDGTMIPLDSVPQTFIFSGSFISTITVNYQGKTFVQTFLNDGTNIIYISNWVNSNAPAGMQIMTDQGGVPMVDENGVLMTTE
jgi:hypothetical protein